MPHGGVLNRWNKNVVVLGKINRTGLHRHLRRGSYLGASLAHHSYLLSLGICFNMLGILGEFGQVYE